MTWPARPLRSRAFEHVGDAARALADQLPDFGPAILVGREEHNAHCRVKGFQAANQVDADAAVDISAFAGGRGDNNVDDGRARSLGNSNGVGRRLVARLQRRHAEAAQVERHAIAVEVVVIDNENHTGFKAST